MQSSGNKLIKNSHEILTLEVGARASPLSQAQVQEIYEEVHRFHPFIRFKNHFMSTIGDRDQTTSLRTLDRTDFFTQDIDAWILERTGRIGIHSAKDLPSPLTKGLVLFCMTPGIDPSDSLVLRPNETLESLKHGAMIATSSTRREEAVNQLKKGLSYCDLRGTIGERLAKLERGEADGVVVAEAALIRLKLTHLNRIHLPGITVPGQGQLAVVGRADDQIINFFFTCLN